MAALHHESERQAVPDLDIDDAIRQPAQLFEEPLECPLQREVGIAKSGLTLKLRIQVEGLKYMRRRFIARQPLANREPLDHTKPQRLDDLHSPALGGIERGHGHSGLPAPSKSK